MRLTSILINGAEYLAQALIRGTEITKEASDRMGTARLSIIYSPTDTNIPAPGQEIAIYAIPGENGEANLLWGQALWGTPMWGETETATKIFGGIVTLIEPKMLRAGALAQYEATGLWGQMQWGEDPWGQAETLVSAAYPIICEMQVECRDWNSLLDGTTIQTAGTYENKTDKYIIEDLIAGSDLNGVIDTTNVASTATLTTFDRREESFRSILQRLQEQTGVVYYVDPSKNLYWHDPTAVSAPFELSEAPNNTTTFGWERETMRFSQEWRYPANRVTVLGVVGDGGTRIRRVVEDLTSQGVYGIFGDTIVDAQIKSNDEADARGAVELARRKVPEYGGSCRVRTDGLEPGMYLTFTATDSLGFSGQFTIRRIVMRWDNKHRTKYDIEWGQYRPDDARTMAALYAMAKPNGAVQPTTPANGTVGNGTIIPGSVTGGVGGSLASATITSANIQNLAVGTAHIQDAAIQEAKIGNAQISTAKIQNLAVTNALILNVSASKIDTDDLLVGGSGKVGQVTIYDGTNTAFGWIGKNGSDYGAWFAQIRAGGTSWSNARFKVANGGAVSMEMIDGDNLELTSSSNSRKVLINNGGMSVLNSSNTGNKTVVLEQWVFVVDSTNYRADLLSSSTEARSGVSTSGGTVLEMKADSTGAFVSFTTLGPVIRSGSGDPEGVVTAPPGSIYLRTDPASSVTAFYVKYTGSGNTGWVAK